MISILGNFFWLKGVLCLIFLCSTDFVCSQPVPNLIPYLRHSDNKWGYADSTGRIVIAIQYRYAFPFHRGLAFVSDESGMGVIDSLGNPVSKFVFQSSLEIYYCNDSIVALKRTGERKFGLVKINGQPLTEFKYTGVGSFNNGFCRVHSESGKFGFVNLYGKEVIRRKYKTDWFNGTGIFEEQVCVVKRRGRYKFITETGQQAVPGSFDEVTDHFCGGVCRVYDNGRYFFIDKSGIEVKANEEHYNNCVEQAGKRRAYDGEDVNAPQPKLDSINSFAREFPYVGYVYGNYYDPQGGLIFSNDYGRITGFYEGLSIVSKDSKMSVIDIKGNLIFEFRYDKIDSFKGGIAKVWQSVGGNGSYSLLGYIDKTGREYWDYSSK